MIRRYLLFALLSTALLTKTSAAQLDVTSRAAISGNFGLEVADGCADNCWIIIPNTDNVPAFRLEVLVRVSDAAIADGYEIPIVAARGPSGTSDYLFQIVLKGSATGTETFVRVLDGEGLGLGGVSLSTSPTPIVGAVAMAVEWRQDPTSGSISFYLDGVLVETISDIDTNWSVRDTRVGAPRGVSGLTGFLALDNVIALNVSEVVLATVVPFDGEAIDAIDGDISSSISWSSDIDGALGTGGGPIAIALSQGTHTITASVTDSRGNVAVESVEITVLDPLDSNPELTLRLPADGSVFSVP